ncbi:MAG: hypothetical protein ACKFI0_00605 [Candidatus Hodgkinia cicadicola]
MLATSALIIEPKTTANKFKFTKTGCRRIVKWGLLAGAASRFCKHKLEAAVTKLMKSTRLHKKHTARIIAKLKAVAIKLG